MFQCQLGRNCGYTARHLSSNFGSMAGRRRHLGIWLIPRCFIVFKTVASSMTHFRMGCPCCPLTACHASPMGSPNPGGDLQVKVLGVTNPLPKTIVKAHVKITRDNDQSPTTNKGQGTLSIADKERAWQTSSLPRQQAPAPVLAKPSSSSQANHPHTTS
jgi:hypothetical protein